MPEGNYGAGEVEIWDEGTYEALQKENSKKLLHRQTGMKPCC
ncbi:hypothetical protein KRR40_22335 [Niabella defluvii]|nr:hypothetical protein KRR40_22335 [Niabella sp. I65]